MSMVMCGIYACAYNGIQILPLVTTGMDLEGIMPRKKQIRQRQILHDSTSMWNLKYKQTNITETDTLIQRTNLWVSEEMGGE